MRHFTSRFHFRDCVDLSIGDGPFAGVDDAAHVIDGMAHEEALCEAQRHFCKIDLVEDLPDVAPVVRRGQGEDDYVVEADKGLFT